MELWHNYIEIQVWTLPVRIIWYIPYVIVLVSICWYMYIGGYRFAPKMHSFAPILLLCHLFVQPMGIICAIVINLLFYFKDIYFKETYLMASLLFYPGLGWAVLTLADLKSFIIKYWFLGCAGWSFLLSLYIDWHAYFKSFFSKFSSSILKSSGLMIFEGRSDFPFTSSSQNISF